MLYEDLAVKEQMLFMAKEKAIVADRELGLVAQEREAREKVCAQHTTELQQKIKELENFEAVKVKLAVRLLVDYELGY